MVIATAAETLQLLDAYSEDGDSQARDQLVTNYVPLIRRICARFQRSREPQEDLFQVGVIGLLNAIEKFDPRYGTKFSSLAIPEVLGAVLNYLRDHGNLVKAPRALRKKKLDVDRVSEELVLRLGRWPTVAELAQACGLSENDVLAAQELAQTGEPRSLDESLQSEDDDAGGTLLDLLGREDAELDLSLDRITLTAALDTLPDREKKIVILRFYRGLSQRQVAERIKISQMHVSRLERGALMKLRRSFQDHAGGPQTSDSDSWSPASYLRAAS